MKKKLYGAKENWEAAKKKKAKKVEAKKDVTKKGRSKKDEK